MMTEKKLKNALCRSATVAALMTLLFGTALTVVLSVFSGMSPALFSGCATCLLLAFIAPQAVAELTTGRKTYQSYAQRHMIGALVDDYNRVLR